MLQMRVMNLVVTERLCVVLQLRLCEFESRPRVHSPSVKDSRCCPVGIEVKARPAASGWGSEVSALINKVFDRYPIIMFNLR